MPSLIRFLFSLAVLAGIGYGAMLALVLYVKPNQREMSEIVPTSKINPVRIQEPDAAEKPLLDGEDASAQ